MNQIATTSTKWEQTKTLAAFEKKQTLNLWGKIQILADLCCRKIRLPSSDSDDFQHFFTHNSHSLSYTLQSSQICLRSKIHVLYSDDGNGWRSPRNDHLKTNSKKPSTHRRHAVEPDLNQTWNLDDRNKKS